MRSVSQGRGNPHALILVFIRQASLMHYITIPYIQNYRGESFEGFRLSYEVAGPQLGTAPIVLVCHALTGNSHVAEDDGWWGTLIGKGRTIDTNKYTIIAFNIPGNAFDGEETDDPLRFDTEDVARLFLEGLRRLGIERLHTIIGASLGGGIAWTIAMLAPALATQLIPVACDYRASDWLLAQTLVQEHILEHSSAPIEDARIHAMLCYRTPESLNERFANRSTRTPGKYDIVSWLDYHGETLRKRFKLSAYKVMTFLTGRIKAAETIDELARISGAIHIVSINSDLLFPHSRALELYETLKPLKADVTLETIDSIHGHDAFLMEYPQLSQLLQPYF